MSARKRAPTAVESTPIKRRKANLACLFCRRSHMTCDDTRPCSRCIRREIGHLCRDEDPTKAGKSVQSKKPTALAKIPADVTAVKTTHHAAPHAASLPGALERRQSRDETRTIQTRSSRVALSPNQSLAVLSNFPLSGNEAEQPFRSEFYGPNLTDFLRSFDDPTLLQDDASLLSFIQPFPDEPLLHDPEVLVPVPPANKAGEVQEPPSALPRPSKDERYLMTAADQIDGPRNERLARVIHAKHEAGLLKPFDFVAGYRRLSRWMETHMSQASRQRTLRTISEFRPAFRHIASSLTDLDLIIVEEEFERLLLDYDRMFANMPIPACLWRRTGEIFKANAEFAQLVGVPIHHLKDGRLAIYELMGGESAGNYWEKYGNVCFDPGQKAVLTTCILRNQSTRQDLACACSFTIRRDAFNLPNAVCGNFLPELFR